MIRLLGAAGAGSLAGRLACATGMATSSLKAIDIHCHIFNAQDLPIAGFVLDVVLSGMPPLQVPLMPLVWLLTLVMGGEAITARDEARQIREGHPPNIAAYIAESGFSVEEIPPGGGITPRLTDDLVWKRVVKAVDRYQNPDPGALKLRQDIQRLMPEMPAAMALSESLSTEGQLLRDLANRAPSLQIENQAERLALRLVKQVTPSEVADGVLAKGDDEHDR